MRKIALMAMPLFALSMSACGGSSKNDNGTFPDAPSLGAQIDRFGRPGLNTALTDPFYDDGTSTQLDQHHMNQDTYNAESDPSKWASISVTAATGTAALVKQFETNLAIFDALDGTCGNQLAFGALGNAAYATLATVLANDQLFVNTASGTCAVYLGVEANALGVTNADCGGRTPSEDIIDVTYNAFASSTLGVNCTTGAGCAVGDGIASDPDGAPTASFPFFNAP